MKTFLISYDLNRPRGANAYPNLIEAIKSFGTWWHHLDSTWIIKSDKAASEIRDALQKHIDNGDELLVAVLSGVAAWVGFDEKASSWLKENLPT